MGKGNAALSSLEEEEIKHVLDGWTEVLQPLVPEICSIKVRWKNFKKYCLF